MAKLATLTDDFEDGVINPVLWSADPGVAESGGHLTITPSVAAPVIRSIATYDAVASAVVIHIPIVTATGTTGTLATGAYLRKDANNAVSITKQSSDVYCLKQVAGVTTAVATFAYNASTMAYWRMRESAGLFYWETSSDGVAWTNRFNTTVATNLFPLTSVWLGLYTAYSGIESSPGNAQIYSVNQGLLITASGTSTSSGSVSLLVKHTLSASAASTSSGSAAIAIHTGVMAMTGDAVSTSSGTASFITLAPGEMTASGQSFSTGSVSFHINYVLTAVGQSFSTGSAFFTVTTPPVDPSTFQYYTFEPPVAYDNPPTLPNPRPRYINAYARWQRGQARGRSVLKNSGVYTVVNTPTVEQTLLADIYYAGGHIYTVDQEEANALSAAGFTVTPIGPPISGLCIYPEETLFPSSTLHPQHCSS